MFALKGAPEAEAEAAVEGCLLGKSVKMFSLFAISVAHSTNWTANSVRVLCRELPKAKANGGVICIALKSRLGSGRQRQHLPQPLKVFTFYLRNYTWANRICVPNGSPSGCVNFLALSARNQTQHPAQKAKGRHCHRVTSESLPSRLWRRAYKLKSFLALRIIWFCLKCALCVYVGVLNVDFCPLIAKSVPWPSARFIVVYKVQGTSHCVDNLWAWSWKFLIRGQWFTFAKRISAKFHCRLRSKLYNLAYAQ